MIKINRFLVVGGDLRNLEIVKLLKEDGKEVFTYGINERESLEKIQENIDIIVGPIPFSRDGRIINSTFGESKILIEEFLKKIKEKILVAGNISSDVIKMAEKYNIKVIDIMKNEKLAILNTIATAEGTIELMISNTDTIIFDSNVLKYFTDEDIEKGYIEVANRKGIIEQFPLTSLSVGVVVADKGRFHNILEIGEIGAQVKHAAKSVMGSSYAIDKRRL